MLSDKEIKEEIKDGTITIEPFSEDLLRPSAYNFTPAFVPSTEVLKDKTGEPMGWKIEAGKTVAVMVTQKISLGESICGVSHQSESLMMEKGLSLLNAGLVDPGWGMKDATTPEPAELTAILKNLKSEPVILTRDDVCFLVSFYKLSSNAELPYWIKNPTHDSKLRITKLEMLSQSLDELDETKLHDEVKMLKEEIQTKPTMKDLYSVFGTLLMAFSLAIALVTGIVVSTASVKTVLVGPYLISSDFILYTLGVIAFVVLFVAILNTKKGKNS